MPGPQPVPELDREFIVTCGRQIVASEQEGLSRMIDLIGDEFVAAVHRVLECRGKVIVTGVGKSGHVGRKIAASMASTGTPAFFVHADEALHGDLGMVGREDVVILISNSGETPELIAELEGLAQIGATLIGMTSNPASTIARACHVHLSIGHVAEADHLGLAPSTSSTATLVLGDALALTLSRLKGFRKERFALYHPGGKLGEALKGGKP